jgi:hypothetical protein
MSTFHFRFAAVIFTLALAGPVSGAGRYLEVTYPVSDKPGELSLGVTYTLWIPEGAKELRGLIVHQHGCGAGACKGGATAAYDLHWQALAKKWDCAFLGPSYQQDDKQNCRLWCDPRNGSDKTFLRALRELAEKSKHPELERVPWCLWGHSGGGFWASLMQTLHPERIVAIWFRSGTAFATWESGEITKPELSDAVYQIPMMCNPGAKENGDKRFSGAWTGTLAMFKAYRAKGAPIGFAPDPRTAHECGDSRYLAIPFFDACLALRLPDRGARDQKLKTIDRRQAWLAELLGDKAEPAASYRGRPNEAVWLPNEGVAKAWAEYVKTGSVSDTTPPPPPFNVTITPKADQGVEITWDATADFESGLQGFIIQRDGKDLARLPEKPAGKFGRPLFQAMSYHDTPEKPLPEMRYLDRTARAGVKYDYRIIAVNSTDLKSEPSPPGEPEKPSAEDHRKKGEPTALGKLAAGMKPGTWAELKTEGYTADLLKVQNHHILEYTGAAAWDPTSQQVLFVGQGHYSALKFISYGAATNAWKLRTTPPWWKGDPLTGQGPIGHGYYNNAIDSTRGAFYLHQSATRLVHRYDIARDEWTTLPEITGAATGHGTAIAWFPERKGLTRVLGGSISFFSEEKKEWTTLKDRLPMGPYHNVAQYSAVHKVVLFGGGNNSKNLYKLDADGKITELKPAPVEVGINTAVVTIDPVSGELLVLHKDDRFYSYNPAKDTWKELSTEGMPFSMKGSSFAVVATPVSDHGVTLFFTAERKGLKVCLYKHATASK